MKNVIFLSFVFCLISSPVYAQSCQNLYDAKAAKEAAYENVQSFDYDGKIMSLEYNFQYCLSNGPSSDREIHSRGCQNDFDVERVEIYNTHTGLMGDYNAAVANWLSIEQNYRAAGIQC